MIILLSGGSVARDARPAGGDQLAIRRRLQELKDETDGGSGMLTTNLLFIEARDAKPHDIIAPASSPPFLGPRRMVVVEGMVERFEPREERGGGVRSIEPMRALFTALEAGLPETTTLVFTAGTHSRRNAFVAALAKVPGVIIEEHSELKRGDVLRYIRDAAALRGLRFRAGPSRRAIEGGDQRERETDPVVLLQSLLQSDTLAIENELDKLYLYTLGGDVTVDTVAEVCAGARQATIFEFVDGVMDGDLRKGYAALDVLRRGSESHEELLFALLGGYRRVATVIDLLEGGATPEAVGVAIKLPYPGLRDAAIARARRLGPAGLRAAYEALVDADRAHKMGEIKEDVALEVLIARLWSLSRPAPAR
ncbi:MAG: DNA polymerase III subunit delta [Tepidiformaceae bacterium]